MHWTLSLWLQTNCQNTGVSDIVTNSSSLEHLSSDHATFGTAIDILLKEAMPQTQPPVAGPEIKYAGQEPHEIQNV